MIFLATQSLLGMLKQVENDRLIVYLEVIEP